MTVSTLTPVPPPPSIDPVLHSSLTSMGMVVASGAATWAVTKGIIPADQQGAFANYIIAFGGYALTAGLGWWKARRNTQESLIKSVNAAPNGVTVVATTDAVAAGIPPVEVPIVDPKPYSP